ncbi:hypothetical protein QN277_003609 [Acacia crassicarpa]|nr:hypothetical protein QN277_003609 [Acacia crassicarpa]
MENASDQTLTHQIFNIGRNVEKSWTPPPTNVVRIDVDGSVCHHLQAACGGVMRDSQGRWLLGFHKNLGLHGVVEAEIYAIWLGLNLANQMGIRKIQIYSDSLDAINAIMRDYHADHPFREIIGKTRDLLYSDWSVELHYTSRRNISCADYLAKQGHDFDADADAFLIPSVSRGCLDMFLRDRMVCCA